jgi:hypothetical protein
MYRSAAHIRSVNSATTLGAVGKQVWNETSSGPVSILKTLAYFDIFHYPLYREEIRQFLDQPADEHIVDQWLDYLVAAKRIYRYHDLYSLQNNQLLGLRRKEGNQRAEVLLKRAQRIGRFLYRFPYVRAIGISGSLSKYFADEKADIDFFIITRSNRLWIARTFMFLFIKFATLLGRRHLYCLNYYIDENAFRLEEQNIFVAIELKTIIPVTGNTTMQDFFQSNEWADTWFPICEYRQAEQADPKRTWFKRSIEWLLNNKLGDRIDQYLFTTSARRWKKKAERGQRNGKGLVLSMHADKHFSRSNPGSFQEKVLKQYEEKIQCLTQ